MPAPLIIPIVEAVVLIVGAYEFYKVSKSRASRQPDPTPGHKPGTRRDDVINPGNVEGKPSPLPSFGAFPQLQFDPVTPNPPIPENFKPPIHIQPHPHPLPPMPQRRLTPDPLHIPTLNDPPTPTSKVNEPIRKRKFGQLVIPNFSLDVPKIELCTVQAVAGDVGKRQKKAKLDFKESKKKGINLSKKGINLNKKSPTIKQQASLLSFQKNHKTGKHSVQPLYGLDSISEILNITAHGINFTKMPVMTAIHKTIEIIECAVDGDVDVDDDDLEHDCCELDGLFIPSRNFKDNPPHSVGYRSQLQVVFGDYDKQITIPSPKLTVDKQAIVAALIVGCGSTSPEFGDHKVEINVTPYGLMRHYSTSKRAGARMFKGLATLINGSLVAKSLRSSDADRTLIKGRFAAHHAWLLEFDIPHGITYR